MTEQRGAYRIQTDRPFLRATLRAAGRAPLTGAVVDLSARGAGIVLSATVEGGVTAGADVELTIESLLLRHPIQVRARIRRWVQDDAETRCAVEFAGRGIPDDAIPFVLRREFNRRTAPRVPITELIEVVVEPRDGGGRLRASLVDLSRDGMRITASEAGAVRMTGWKQVDVAFVLPERDGVLRLPALVRSCDEKDVGLAFDLDQADELGAELAAIDAFVQRRLAAPAQPQQP